MVTCLNCGRFSTRYAFHYLCDFWAVPSLSTLSVFLYNWVMHVDHGV
jgi:hypothetical protein